MNDGYFGRDCGILVIDDHAISRLYITEALGLFSGNIKQVESGSQALSITRGWFPRLIYTDIHLPDMCGLELVQKIRYAWPRELGLPQIVIITGDDSPAMKQKAAQASVAAMLLKPVQMEDIRASAEQLICPGSTVKEKSAQNRGGIIDQQLCDLFTRELTTRLPVLDRHISQLNWTSAGDILHQLIASAAMCRKKELERSSRLLYRAISSNPQPRPIAQAYHPFLQAVARTKMQSES